MSQKTHDDAFVELVDACRARIEELTVGEVLQMRGTDDPFFFIDVREDREVAVDSCAGSIHIGKGVLERDIGKHVDDLGARIVLYCGGGYRSALAAESLQRMGYMNVASMDGGIRGWRQAAAPLQTTEGT